MKKMIFGIAVATATLSASAITTINDDFTGELVGKLAPNQWEIIDQIDQGVTWDCFSGGTTCTGTLKAGATPDSAGQFSDAEVNHLISSTHFEYYVPND